MVHLTTKIHMTTLLNCSSSFKRSQMQCITKHYDALHWCKIFQSQNRTSNLAPQKSPCAGPGFLPGKTKPHHYQSHQIRDHLFKLYHFLSVLARQSGCNFSVCHIRNFCQSHTFILLNQMSYLAMPPWHTSSSWAPQVRLRPLSPLCFASHHLQHLDNNGIFKVSSG